jgi:hypothetical protein
MVRAGFEDAGPDPLDPANATWGASALLAGPDLERLSQSGGNAYGYTDRLDYIFTKNGVRVVDVALVGQRWPDGEHMWACSDPQQVDNARAAAEMLGVPLGEAFCLPTDHVGLIATLDVPPGTSASPAGGIERTTGMLILIGVLLMSGVVALWAVRRSRLHDQPSP